MGSKFDARAGDAEDGAGKKMTGSFGEQVVTTLRYEHLAPRRYEDIIILDGPDTPTPAGYVKFTSDLNRGAGGAFLFLCVKAANPGQITDLSIIDTGPSNGQPSAPNGFTLVHDQSNRVVDLNRGAGGSFLWLSFNKNPSANVITGLQIVASNTGRPDQNAGWTRIPVELNEGAGGWWIYLEYKKT